MTTLTLTGTQHRGKKYIRIYRSEDVIGVLDEDGTLTPARDELSDEDKEILEFARTHFEFMFNSIIHE